jgi:AmmeMemoRadiSam system protein A
MVETAGRSVGPISVPEPELAPASERLVLDLARRAVVAALGGPDLDIAPDDLPPDLHQEAGAFVTITRDGELRSCMGRLDPATPLWANLAGAAEAAARSDPRFPPILLDELPHLRLEVSALGPMVPLTDPAAFIPGVHGIVVERGWRRGLLLPQVATGHGWGARDMLEGVCMKAGLPSDAWRDRSTRLLVFAAHIVSEAAEVPGT